jgi:hypothetical protein
MLQVRRRLGSKSLKACLALHLMKQKCILRRNRRQAIGSSVRVESRARAESLHTRSLL